MLTGHSFTSLLHFSYLTTWLSYTAFLTPSDYLKCTAENLIRYVWCFFGVLSIMSKFHWLIHQSLPSSFSLGLSFLAYLHVYCLGRKFQFFPKTLYISSCFTEKRLGDLWLHSFLSNFNNVSSVLFQLDKFCWPYHHFICAKSFSLSSYHLEIRSLSYLCLFLTILYPSMIFITY